MNGSASCAKSVASRATRWSAAAKSRWPGASLRAESRASFRVPVAGAVVVPGAARVAVPEWVLAGADLVAGPVAALAAGRAPVARVQAAVGSVGNLARAVGLRPVVRGAAVVAAAPVRAADFPDFRRACGHNWAARMAGPRVWKTLKTKCQAPVVVLRAAA